MHEKNYSFGGIEEGRSVCLEIKGLAPPGDEEPVCVLDVEGQGGHGTLAG